MYDPLYKRSLCAGSYLHRYQILKVSDRAVVEVCAICKDVQYFKHDEPSKHYREYHMRDSLQPYQPIFHHEYGKPR